jgi:hypothetical protein
MSGDTITRIHAVLTTLTPLLDAAMPEGATPDETVAVWDGPRLGEWPWQIVVLGLSDDPRANPPYTCRYQQQDGLGRARYVETFAIRTLVSVSVGQDDAIAAARARVVEILGAIDTVLGEHQVERGVWDEIGVGDTQIDWFTTPSEHGGVNVSAFVSIEGSAIL